MERPSGNRRRTLTSPRCADLLSGYITTCPCTDPGREPFELTSKLAGTRPTTPLQAGQADWRSLPNALARRQPLWALQPDCSPSHSADGRSSKSASSVWLQRSPSRAGQGRQSSGFHPPCSTANDSPEACCSTLTRGPRAARDSCLPAARTATGAASTGRGDSSAPSAAASAALSASRDAPAAAAAAMVPAAAWPSSIAGPSSSLGCPTLPRSSASRISDACSSVPGRPPLAVGPSSVDSAVDSRSSRSSTASQIDAPRRDSPSTEPDGDARTSSTTVGSAAATGGWTEAVEWASRAAGIRFAGSASFSARSHVERVAAAFPSVHRGASALSWAAYSSAPIDSSDPGSNVGSDLPGNNPSRTLLGGADAPSAPAADPRPDLTFARLLASSLAFSSFRSRPSTPSASFFAVARSAHSSGHPASALPSAGQPSSSRRLQQTTFLRPSRCSLTDLPPADIPASAAIASPAAIATAAGATSAIPFARLWRFRADARIVRRSCPSSTTQNSSRSATAPSSRFKIALSAADPSSSTSRPHTTTRS